MISKGEMISVADYYSDILKRSGVEPLSASAALMLSDSEEKLPLELSGKSAVVDLQRQLAYVGWMLTEMRRMAFSGSINDQQKFVRWLCFIQGVMWVSGILTIPEARRDIRHLTG